MKPVIIALVGESGTGKTTLSLYLEKTFQIPSVVSYTTRSKREEEVNGREHWFVKLEEMPSMKEMFAYTYFANNHYWSLLKDIEEHAFSTYVIDEKGLLALQKEWSDKFTIIPIHIVRPNNPTDNERKDRDKERVEYKDYDYEIINDDTLEDFFAQAERIVTYIYNTNF